MQHSESSGGAASDHTNTVTTTGGEDSSEATGAADAAPLSRYESQKKRDWTTFLQYLKTHKPPLSLAGCSGVEVIEFMKYLDQFGKTRVHEYGCIYFGCQDPPATCGCPLKQAWGSLDSLIGRLRAAYEENGSGGDFVNPFGSKYVRSYLTEVRDVQAKARGIPHGKKRKRPATAAAAAATGRGSSSIGGCSSGDASTG